MAFTIKSEVSAGREVWYIVGPPNNERVGKALYDTPEEAESDRQMFSSDYMALKQAMAANESMESLPKSHSKVCAVIGQFVRVKFGWSYSNVLLSSHIKAKLGDCIVVTGVEITIAMQVVAPEGVSR